MKIRGETKRRGSQKAERRKRKDEGGPDDSFLK